MYRNVDDIIENAFDHMSHKLVLSMQKLKTIPTAIKHMDWLTVLDLDGNQIQKIENLPKNLKTIILNGNKISKIENLPHTLTRIDLKHNNIRKIESLPPDLIHLDLRNNQISKIENLPDDLRWLYLSFNKINKIENLPDNLEKLYLGNNQVSTIENLPETLKQIYIRNNGIEKIDGLPPRLITLDLRHNLIRHLSRSWDIIKQNNLEVVIQNLWHNSEYKINLFGNPIEEPPIDIALQGHNFIEAYLNQNQKENHKQDYLFESKLLILGESGAGKTSFARRIQNPKAKLPNIKETTHGIEIGKWNFPIKSGEFDNLNHKDSTFFANLWDFGGQEVYHGTHKFFFSEKSLYVLLVDTREEKTDFSFWLNTIEQLGGEESSLIVLMNKRENRNYQLNENGYRARFGSFFKEVYTVDLANSEDIPDLQTQIKNQLKALPDVGVKLIESWVRIREDVAEEKGHSITFARFREICKGRGVTDSGFIKNISRYFHRIGVFSHFIDDPILEDKIYLNSDWLTDAVYEVLDNQQAQDAKGRLTQKQLEAIASAKSLDFEYRKLIALLEKFGLMYQTQSEGFIIPRHLSAQQPYPVWAHELIEPKIHFRYTFDKYMPRGLMSQLIVALHGYIPNHDLVWNRGFNLSHNGAHAEIIEQYGGTNQFDILIVGEFRRDLLVIIAQAFDKMLSPFKKLEYFKKVKCPCQECYASHNPHFFNTKSVENAIIKKQKTAIDCEKSYDEVQIIDLVAFVDYEQVLREIQSKGGGEYSEKILSELEKLGIKFDSFSFRNEVMHRMTHRELSDIKGLIQTLPQTFREDLKTIENHLENLNINDARIEMLIEQVELEIKELPASNEWKQHFAKAKESSDWDIGAQGKFELMLPIIPGILHYKGELNAGFKSKLKDIWKNLKDGKLFFE